jgi:hypothetical protein
LCQFTVSEQKSGSCHSVGQACIMAEMPGRYSGERSGSLDLAAKTVLMHAVAVVLLLAGLLLRFGALCPDDVTRSEAAVVRAAGSAFESSYLAHPHAGHGDDHDCHHQPYHARFAALTATAIPFVIDIPSLLADSLSKQLDRPRTFIVRATPRAPPARHIALCVQLI